MLQFNNTSFTLPSGQSLLTDLNLTVEPGDFVVILGSNGSGKSTLIKLVNRLYHHTQGELLFQQCAIQSYADSLLNEKVATLSQSVADSLFMALTVEENGRLIDYKRKKTWAHKEIFCQALQEYLAGFNTSLSQSLKTPIYRLSGGQQQILAFALYLRHQPDLLLLDEHTSALDPKTAIKIMEFTQKIISDRNITCLMTTHNLDFAINYGNRIIVINQGKIDRQIDDIEKQRLNKAELLELCY